MLKTCTYQLENSGVLLSFLVFNNRKKIALASSVSLVQLSYITTLLRDLFDFRARYPKGPHTAQEVGLVLNKKNKENGWYQELH